MGVEGGPVSSALAHANALEVLSFPYYRVLLPALESMEGKKNIQAIQAHQRTFTFKITEEQHFNYWERLHKLKL